MVQPFNSDKMAYASFSTREAAELHRSNYGGWIFVPQDGSEYIWFDLSFTPTPILKHKATAGMSGMLF